MTTSWKVEVTFTLKSRVNHASFIEVQFNNQQQKLFAMQIRTVYEKLVIADFAARTDGNTRHDIEPYDSGRYSPQPNKYQTVMLRFEPSLDAKIKSSLHYELKDETGVTLGTGTIKIDIHGSLGIITLHNGSTRDAEKGVDIEAFGGRIWTYGIQAA